MSTFEPAGSGALLIPPGPGLPHGLRISADELDERFSRSSGPGGQGVNTTDSKVELRYDITTSRALDDLQRGRALRATAGRAPDGVLVVVASEHRSQRANRKAARVRLAATLRQVLAPGPPSRRATRPSAGSRRRRLEAKSQRGQLKSLRRKPPGD